MVKPPESDLSARNESIETIDGGELNKQDSLAHKLLLLNGKLANDTPPIAL